MSKRQSPASSAGRGIRRVAQKKRKAKNVGVDPTIVDGLREKLGREPTAQDVQELQMKLVSEMLQHAVEVRMAQWLEGCLLVLKDEFEFDEGQLAHFAREFMERTRVVRTTQT